MASSLRRSATDLRLVEELARRLAGAPARAGTTRVLAVDGPSGAGKSTLAAAVADLLPAQVVALDDLIPGWDGLADGPLLAARDVLAPLAQGRSGTYQRYDWVRREYAGPVTVAAADYLVLEGCGAGARVTAPYVSLLVWVDADRELRLRRGLERDGAAYAPYWLAWEAQEQVLLAVDDPRPRADVLVEG